LLAAVEADVASAFHGVLAGGAIMRAAGAIEQDMAVARRAVVIVGLGRGADAHAGLGARNVVEPITIERADLHVFDRLGLDGKIGGLRPRDRNDTRCGAEEKTFHHLHLNLQVPLWEGSSPPGAAHPWKVPFAPEAV